MDADTGNDVGDCIQAPCATIQYAINQSDPGDTVSVAAGYYTGSVTILVDGLTLQSSAGADETIIDADEAENGVEIGDHSHPGNHPTNVTVEGFTVTGWIERGISQRNGDGTVHIRDNIVLNENEGSRNGINISGGTGSTVTNNVIDTGTFDQDDWSGTGILLMGAVNGLVEGNTITGPDLGIAVSAHPGWSHLDPNWAEASDNVVRNNTIHGVDAGVSIQGNASGSEIDGNDISDSFWGVTLTSSTMDGYPSDTTITNNQISDTVIALYFGDPGAYDTGFVNVEDNVFEDNEILVYDLGDLVNLAEVEQGNQINHQTRWVDSDAGFDTDDCIATPCKTIQYAIGQANEFDIVQIAAGTYPEQLTINKSLTVSGGPDVIIEAPASLAAFEIPENNSIWRPIVLVYGGSKTDGEISGTRTILVDVTGIEVDGRDHLVPSGSRYVGILYRNASGVVVDNIVSNMYVAFEGDPGRETMGILVYGDSDVIVSDNQVSGYARGGISIQGSGGAFPEPYGVVTDNMVTGPGAGADVVWAPNGIQVINGAGGEVRGNVVKGNSHPAADPGGVVVIGSDAVTVADNVIVGNDAGIQIYDAVDTKVSGNSISSGTYGIDVGYGVSDLLIDGNQITDQFYDGILVWTTTDPISNVVIINNSIDGTDWGITIWGDAMDISDLTITDNVMGDNNQQLVDISGGIIDEEAFVEDNQFSITTALEILQGVPAPLESGNGWAGFTAHLTSSGGIPENVVLWIEVDGIDDAVYGDGLNIEFFDDGQWRHLGWGGANHWQLNRDAFFLGRDGNEVNGFEIDGGYDEFVPLRVNWPNGAYSVTVTLESLDSGDGAGEPGERIWLDESYMLDVTTTSEGEIAVTADGANAAGQTLIQGNSAMLQIAAADVRLPDDTELAVVFDGQRPGDVSPQPGEEVCLDLLSVDDCRALGDAIGFENLIGADGAHVLFDDNVSIRTDAVPGPYLLRFFLVEANEGSSGALVHQLDVDVTVESPTIRIEAVSSTTIAGEADEPVSAGDLPTVQVLDQQDNPVEGVTVGFEVTSGGGSVSGATQVTDTDGLAHVGAWILGTEETQTLTATAPGLVGSPVVFTAQVDAVVELDINIDDNRDTIESGNRNTWVIVASNHGPSDAEGATVAIDLPVEVDSGSADWACFPSVGTSCSASGTGAIDDTVNLPAGSSVTYLLEADVLYGAQIEILAILEFGEIQVQDISVTDIIVTEDHIFRDRFEEDPEHESMQLDSKSHIEGHLEIDESFSAGLPPRHLLIASDEAGNKVFRVRTLYFDGQTRSRVEVSDSHGGWSRSEWLQLDPAAQGMIGFDYDAEWGQLIVAGYTQHVDVQARGAASRVHSLSTDHPEEVAITIYQ